MHFIAFSPAALLRFVEIAVQHRLTEDETCAVVRRLHADHAHGIIPVQSVEKHAADVLIVAVAAD